MLFRSDGHGVLLYFSLGLAQFFFIFGVAQSFVFLDSEWVRRAVAVRRNPPRVASVPLYGPVRLCFEAPPPPVYDDKVAGFEVKVYHTACVQSVNGQ